MWVRKQKGNLRTNFVYLEKKSQNKIKVPHAGRKSRENIGIINYKIYVLFVYQKVCIHSQNISLKFGKNGKTYTP